MDIIADFLKSFPQEKLIVFLHPKEKNDLDETEKYYTNWLKKEQVVFYTENLPSSHVFYKAEYGIGSYSTILFERDYFGFKTLLLNEEERDFPLKGTKFYLNSFKSSKDLVEKVNNYIN
ncbi:MAG: hypothetical protein IPG89_18485 [Bacteroidetes bacterium]|nr:hypothetical protein [Bacteroidota bacterium]